MRESSEEEDMGGRVGFASSCCWCWWWGSRVWCVVGGSGSGRSVSGTEVDGGEGKVGRRTRMLRAVMGEWPMLEWWTALWRSRSLRWVKRPGQDL